MSRSVFITVKKKNSSFYPRQSDEHKYEPQTFITLSTDEMLRPLLANGQLILDPTRNKAHFSLSQ